VILPLLKSGNDPKERKYLDAVRKFLHSHGDHLAKERLTVSYMFADRQPEFMKQFDADAFTGVEGMRGLLVLWRHEYVKAKYTWLPAMLSDADMHISSENLKENLYLITRGTIRLENTAPIVSIVRFQTHRLNLQY